MKDQLMSKEPLESETRPVAIDFKKYRSPELAASVTEIVDVRGKFLTGFKTVFFVFAVFLLLAGLLFWGQDSFTKFILGLGYSVVAGGVFSLAMAIAGIVKRSLSEMEDLVALLFSTTNQVAQDVASLDKGDIEMPSARELVEGVYGDVVLPAVEQVVGQSLGWFGKPILMAYRMTLGRVVRGAIRLVPDAALAQSETAIANKADGIMDRLSVISDQKSQTLSTLQWAKDHLDTLGTKAKFLVLLPCYIVATIVALVVLTPLVVLYFWV